MLECSSEICMNYFDIKRHYLIKIQIKSIICIDWEGRGLAFWVKLFGRACTQSLALDCLLYSCTSDKGAWGVTPAPYLLFHYRAC